VLVAESCFLVAIRKSDVLCFVQVIGISNFGTVAISLQAPGRQVFFFAPSILRPVVSALVGTSMSSENSPVLASHEETRSAMVLGCGYFSRSETTKEGQENLNFDRPAVRGKLSRYFEGSTRIWFSPVVKHFRTKSGDSFMSLNFETNSTPPTISSLESSNLTRGAFERNVR
jgi:hypothetical protein